MLIRHLPRHCCPVLDNVGGIRLASLEYYTMSMSGMLASLRRISRKAPPYITFTYRSAPVARPWQSGIRLTYCGKSFNACFVRSDGSFQGELVDLAFYRDV